MKLAVVRFSSPAARREYQDAMRARLYDVGYEPYQVTDMFRMGTLGPLMISFSGGTADVERAADVANEVRGATCKISDT